MPPSKHKNTSNLTLVLDQGSHASRIAIFSAEGTLLQLESTDISTHHPKKDYFEQDANEIIGSLQALLYKLDDNQIVNITSCGLCTQRSTVVAWHRQTGKALSPVLSWRDMRAQKLINELKPNIPDSQQITGLPFSAHYSAGKIHWLLQHNPEVKQAAEEQQLCIAPLSSFLLFHLLNEEPFVIDHSNAQRSQLFDIQSLDWSDKLLQLFQINRNFLPQCKPISYHYGYLKELDIPLTAVCGDQNAVLHAYPQLANNKTLINIGTGAFILSRLAEQKSSAEDTPKLLRSIVNSRDSNAEYITEGTVNGAGAALNWAQKNDPCENIFTRLPEWLNETISPPLFINAVSGLGSPWWCDPGPAEYIGNNISKQSNRYVAIIESIVFLLYKNLQHLQSVKDKQEILFISGGLSQLDGLCQKLADLCQLNIIRFADTEASARGCAWLANQLSENNHLKWKPLEVSHQFKPSNNPLLLKRYQQFVGELYKRCRKS